MAVSSIVKLLLKTRTAPPTGRRQGLRKLSPDLISKARDETAAQVTRIGLTFLATSAFCLLSLLSPDSALLGSAPLALGPVSFFGFMLLGPAFLIAIRVYLLGFKLLGPAFLIAIRVYLQIYVEHSERLEGLARSMPAPLAPNLVPLQNPLIRFSGSLIFYLLLPLAMMLFAWKAAVFPAWGLGLLCVALGVIVSHVMLWLNRFRRLWPLPLKVLTSILAAFAVLGAVFSLLVAPDLYPPGVRRPFNLTYAILPRANLSGADLARANLTGALLSDANLNISGGATPVVYRVG